MIVLLSLFIVFYFNQFASLIISKAAGWYLWKHHQMTFVVGSLQISILGGQIFVKNVKFIYKDHAISIVHATLHWRFWLRRSRVAALFAQDLDEMKKPACQLCCEIHGAEIFVFNRSIAYDNIEDLVNGIVKPQRVIGKEIGYFEEFLLRLLPLEIKVRRSSVVMGNVDTESLLVLTSKHMDCIIDVDRASNDYDRYMILAKTFWERPKITLHPNLDYHKSRGNVFPPSNGSWFRLGKVRKRDSSAWRGLNRYNDAEGNDEVGEMDSNTAEYARVSTVFEAEEMMLEHFLDVVGPNVESETPLPAPLFHTNIIFTSASINYGPWTDRQRLELVNAFFPQVCVDAKPAANIHKAGTMREAPKMRITFDFVNQFNLHIPIREPSKDMQWIHHLINSQAANTTRAYGWIDISADQGSNGEVEVDLLAHEYGYRNVFKLFLDKLQVRTSVNHDLAIKTKNHTISLVQTVPLKWNGLQKWDILFKSMDLDFFFLREQATLLIDYFKDISSPQDVDYSHFVPAVYSFKWSADNLKLWLNVNSQNIINNPTSLEENTYLVFRTKAIDLTLDLSADQVRPLTNTSKITLATDLLDLEVSAPPWHMLHSFLESNHLGRVYDFRVDLSYTYNCVEDSKNAETEIINVYGRDFTLIAHGFAINYLMTIRENYFGQNYHFQTSEEYYEKLTKNDVFSEEYEFSRYDPDLDVQMHFDVQNCCLVLPAYLYSAKACIALHFANLAAEMRFTNYYMDLQAELSPMTGYLHKELELELVPDLAKSELSDFDDTSVAFVSEFIVTAHRMFGLPPSEPTYVCCWNIELGDVILDGPFDMLDILGRIMVFAGHSFKGIENKPITEEPELFDVTFLCVDVKSFALNLHSSDNTRIEYHTSAISLRKNDYANERYSGRSTTSIPNIELRGFHKGELVLLLQTSAACSVFSHAEDPLRQYQMQQEHIALHDMLFHRCPFLLDRWHRSNPPYSTKPPDHIVPAVSLPPLPPQLTQELVANANPQSIALDFQYDRLSKFSASSRSHYSGSNSNLFSSNDSCSSSDISESSSRVKAKFEPAKFAFNSKEKFFGFLPPEGFHEAKTKQGDHDFDLNGHESYPGAPSLPKFDESLIYDDIVFELGPLTATVLPQTIQLIDAVSLHLNNVDLTAAFDKMHCRVVQVLTKEDDKHCFRALISTETVDIKLGMAKNTQHGTSSGQDEPIDICLEPNHVLLSLEKLNIMVQIGPSKVPNVVDLGLDVLSLSVNTSQDALTRNAVSLRVNQLAGWFVLDNEDSVGQIHTDNIDLFWAEKQLGWVTRYILELFCEIDKLKKLTVSKTSSHKEMAYAMLEVARASERHNVEQDSYVLSRPFGSAQSQNHTRSHISWRISVRLRHLLNLLPSSEIQEIERTIENRTYEVPSDAKKQVMDIFSRWRSWEQTEDLDSALVFTHTFGERPKKWDRTAVAIRCGIDSITTRLNYGDHTEDFFILDYTNMHGSFKPAAATVFTSLMITCAKARTHLSTRTMKPIATVAKTIAEFEHPELLRELFNPKRPADLKPRQSSARAVKGFVLVFIQDFGFEASLRSFGAELQCKQVQALSTFISSSTEWYHTTIAAMASSCLSAVNSTGTDLFDYILDSVNVGLIGWEAYTRVASNVGELSLVSNAHITEFCNLVTNFFETDLEDFKKFLAIIHETRSKFMTDLSEDTSTGSRSDSTRTMDGTHDREHVPIHFNLDVTTITIKTVLLENLRAALTGEHLVVRSRQPDHATTLADIHLDRGVLGMLYGAGSPVVSVELLDVSNIIRYEPDFHALDLLNSVKLAKLDTMELLWFLDLLKEENIAAEIEQVMSTFNSIATKYADALESLPSEENLKDNVTTDSQQLSSYSVRIDEAQLSLPLSDATFIFIARYMTGHFLNFKRDDRDKPFACPVELFGSLDELRVELLSKLGGLPSTPQTPVVSNSSSHQPPVLAVQFTAAYNHENDLQKLEISSNYCKLVLDPVRAVSISRAVTKLQSRSTFFETIDKSEVKHDRDSAERNIATFFESLRAVFALKNQSFTWQTKNGGGIVVGNEALNIRQNGLTARMDMHEFYIQPDSSHSQYGSKIALPSLALSVVVLKNEGEHFVYINNSGESLNIDVSAAVVPLLVGLADSVDEAKRLYSEGLSDESMDEKPDKPPQVRSPIRLPFSLHGLSSISRARIRLFEEYGSYNTPSLELHSPAAKITVDYRRKTIPLRDVLNIDISISESSNTIYPKALQELRNMVRNIEYQLAHRHVHVEPHRTMASSISPQSPPTPTKPRKLRIRTDIAQHTPTISTPVSSSVEDFHVLLSAIEYTIFVNFSAQQLELSCDPFAKVATTLLYDGITVVLTSPMDELSNQYLALSGSVRGAKVALRHIFSHETSIEAGIGTLSFTVIHRQRSNTPIEIGVSTADPEFSLKVSKINDIRSFIDIWTPVTSLPNTDVVSPASPKAPQSSPTGSTHIQIYRKAMASIAFQWSLVWHVRNVKGYIDLGQSVGKAELTLDWFWLSSLKKSQRRQYFAGGIGAIVVSCEGRVGGALDVKGTNAHLTVEFGEDPYQTPQVLFVAGIPSFDAYLSLDFNPFLALRVAKSSIAIGNTQRPSLDYDELEISFQCESASATFTALAASHLYDMADLIGTFKMPSSTVPLGDGGDDLIALKRHEINDRTLNLLTRLKVKLNLKLGETVLYVFPSDLSESTAMCVSSGGMHIFFTQWLDQNGLHSEFNFETHRLLLSLAAMQTSFSAADVTSLQVDSFFKAAASSSKNNIVTIPKCKMFMYALLKPNGRHVCYTFSSDFMGTVEVGWNLGSVAFIREISSVHSKAWDVRKKIYLASLDPSERAKVGEIFVSQPTTPARPRSADSQDYLTDDKNSMMSLEDFEVSRKLFEALINSDLRFAEIPKYHHIEPPRINIPQLHDMGEATPPVEWIGLDRHKLPEAIHWYPVRALNGIIFEVEQIYGGVIERM